MKAHKVYLTTYISYGIKVEANSEDQAVRAAEALLRSQGKEYFIQHGEKYQDPKAEHFLIHESEIKR